MADIWGVIGKAVSNAAKAVSSGGRNERNDSSAYRTLDVGADGKASSDARIGDVIRTGGGDYRITGGTAGNWTSERLSDNAYSGGRDWSAVMNDPTATYAQKLEAYNNRSGKESDMRAARTWNNSWLPTSAYKDRLSSDYNAAQNSTSPYASASSSYADMMRSNEDRARELYAAKVRQGVDRLNAQKAGINQSYDNAATQAYVNYMQGQRQLPQQMASLGMTGGASESSMIGARSAYEGNINNVNTARQKALSDIDSAIIDLQNSGDIETAQYVLNNADKIAENYVQALYSDIGRSDTMRQNDISNAYQRAGLTGDLGGTPTLQSRQLDLESQQYQNELKAQKFDRAYKLMSAGFSNEQVAADLGVSKQEVDRILAQIAESGNSGGGASRSGSRKKKKRSGSSHATVSFGTPTTAATGTTSINPFAFIPFLPPGALTKLSQAKPKPSTASMMTSTEWARHKNSGNSKDPAMVFNTYADYVKAYKQAITSNG